MMVIKLGTDFSGVGSVNQALKRLGLEYEEVFACEMDKYARMTYIHNYGEPKYYPTDVYDREIPKESLDLYITTPPCQAFSLAGKRKGEEDKRGILFYNSHEFIQENKPRYFIFENVKGLLSMDNGQTFQNWVTLLGGGSVNGNLVIFPHEDSVPYHVYYKVLNAKNHGVPQNRERVFIIGIRDDQDNNFSFPKEIQLEKRLRDVLEDNVDEKYFLSQKMIDGFINKKGDFGDRFSPKDENSLIGNCITTVPGNRITDNFIKIGFINQDTQASQVYSEDGIIQTLCSETHGYANGYVYIKSANSKGYEIAEEEEEDSINFEHPNSETRRGRVGKKVAQTLTTSCNQGVLIGAIRGRNPLNTKSRKSGEHTEQMLEINENGTSNTLTTVHKDNVVVEFNLPGKHEQNSRVYNSNGISPTLTTMQGGGQEPKIFKDYKIRKLTPRECFRLMDYPDTFDFSCVSDSQAYKQAGNGVVVKMFELLIKELFLKVK